MPAQWFEPPTAVESGERRLLFAIFADGITLAGRGSRAAQAWMRSESVFGPFTFVRLCELFDYDPAQIRRRLLGRTAVVRRVYRIAESGRPGLDRARAHRGRAA